jgi:Cdc6-like AAA superfamily ATPase
MTSTATSLIARDEELSRLRQLVAPPYDRSRVFVILGDPGAGKTLLLAEAARAARSAGMRAFTAPTPSSASPAVTSSATSSNTPD